MSAPSSWSVPEAKHVQVSPTCVPVVVIVAFVRNVGSVLPTVSVAVRVAVPPLGSLTVTEHSTTSLGETELGVSCSVLAVDENAVLVLRFVHA